MQQPWELYYHNREGYTALNNQGAIASSNVIVFPVKTNESFSKIRLDPGGKKIAQNFIVQKIELTINEQVVHAYKSSELLALCQPLNHIDSLGVAEDKSGIFISTSKKGDPQLEFNIGRSGFDDGNPTKKRLKVFFAIFLVGIIFIFLTYPILSKRNLKYLNEITLPTSKYALYLLFVGLFFILFGVLLNREKLIPLKLLTIELEEDLAISQDRWKVYLNADGYKESLSKSGLNIGRKILFPITADLNFSSVRIDPGGSEQAINIQSIQLKSGLETVYAIEGEEVFNQITPLNQIDNIGYDATGQFVSFQAKNGDPFFEVPITNQHFEDKQVYFEVLIAFLLSFLITLLTKNREKIADQFKTGTSLVKALYIANGLALTYQLWFLGELNYVFLLLNIFGLFILPGVVIRRVSGFETDNSLFTGLLNLALGVGTILLPLYITYSLNIPNGHYLSFGLAIILGFIYVRNEIRTNDLIKPKTYTSYFNLKNLGYFTFFNILFCLFVLPIGGLLCPPLHDPAVIATAANEIIEEGFIKNALHKDLWNYPPYLQLLVAFLAKFSFLSTPKTILFLTNLMVIGSGFAFGLFWQSFFKNKYVFYVSTLLFLFVAPTIPSLYFTAGKNAMIFSIFYWFLILALLAQLVERATNLSFKKGILFALLVIAAFQFHYTTIFIFPIIALFFAFRLIIDFREKRASQLSKNGSMIGGLLMAGILFGLFGVYQLQEATYNQSSDLFYAKITETEEKEKRTKLQNVPFEKDKEQSVQNLEKPIKQKKESVLKKQKEPTTASKTNNRSTEVITKEKETVKQRVDPKKVASTKSKKRENKVFRPTITFLNKAFSELLLISSKNYSLFKIPLLSSSAGLILLILFFFSKRKKEIGLILIFALTIIILNNSNVYNLVHYTKVLFFMVPLLTAAFFLNYLVEILKEEKRYIYLLITVLLLIASQQAIFLSKKYYDYKYYSPLTHSDLKAFNFIDNNLEKDKFFSPLNVANINDFVSAQGDAALYLHLTNMESIFSYVPSKKIYLNRSTLLRLPYLMNYWRRDLKKSEENLLNRIKALNVKYIYSGAFAPWGRQIPIKRLKDSPNFSLIYDKEGVQIFEIK